jgi:hypothetical protein
MIQVFIFHETFHIDASITIATQDLPLLLNKVQHPQTTLVIANERQTVFLLEQLVIEF